MPSGRKGIATDGLLSLTAARVRIRHVACEKITSDLELGGNVDLVLRVSSSTYKWLFMNKS